MSSLTNREKRVIMHRFGLGEIRERTLEEIGKIEGITRERVRQIERRTLNKMRRGEKASMLRDLL